MLDLLAKPIRSPDRLNPKPVRSHRRTCRVCGKSFHSNRFDALTCSDPCQKDRREGRDLAYIQDLPPAHQHARRAIHQADLDAIDIEKMVRTAQRERRRDAKAQKQRPVHLKANPDPAPEEPPKHRGGNFITV
jgi:hypothetical protein